ncbi:biliverdin-producing heme oxygenase [Portibacter marinus]|uniref:biliverdin-producing heme oxygenase n=1 Tax=Portibacter marinus TaxID=2898660 RepID=UPI001F236D1D|nr:biliverdin-producing heme oxygenase [Portibacter marinus]
MSSNDILTLLREKTAPLHQKLDEDGVGQLIKQGTFNTEHYHSWLLVTHQINAFLYSEKEHFKDSPFYKYLSGDLGLRYIQEDHRDSDDLYQTVSGVVDRSFHDHMDYMVAVAYTFLGSTLGSAYILKYVQKDIPEASTRFLEFMVQQIKNWKLFKSELQEYDFTVEPDQISEYGRALFKQITLLSASMKR